MLSEVRVCDGGGRVHLCEFGCAGVRGAAEVRECVPGGVRASGGAGLSVLISMLRILYEISQQFQTE